MEMEIITTNKGHKYIYDRSSGFITLCPDDSSGHLEEKNIYLQRKIKYLQKYGLITSKESESSNYRLLHVEDIKEAVINTHQIILEVTDRCNLKCYYCGYGELYGNHDVRCGEDMSFETFLTLYQYLGNLLKTSHRAGSSFLRISFYGGEPLCNFPLIEKVVSYTKEHPIENKSIVFSMTTNAVLLHKHMDFFVENKFELLISLDGNKYNDSYRVFQNGKESFASVIENLHTLRSLYPEYFSRNIRFNSVLHNRNSVSDADNFIYTRYGKHPMTNELNVFGISKDKVQEFKKMFRSKAKDFDGIKKKGQDNLLLSPFVVQCEKWIFSTFLTSYSRRIGELLNPKVGILGNFSSSQIPTKTCIPFSRKIFVSVTGKIYPCERIGNEYDFGEISNGNVNIPYSDIADTYNALFEKYLQYCKRCKMKDFCSVCVVSDIDGYNVCNQNVDHKSSQMKDVLSFFEDNPYLLDNSLKNITII